MHTSLGVLGAAATTPLAQRQGEASRMTHEAANHARQVAVDRSAASVAGVGQTESNQPASDRDADGRRLWETSPSGKTAPEEEIAAAPTAGKDPTGQSGSQLDVSG